MNTETSFADNYALSIELPGFDYIEKGWRDWRVWAIDHHLERRKVRLNVFLEGATLRTKGDTTSVDFLLDLSGRNASERFIAFAVACGIRDEISNTREFLGRVVSMRRVGKLAIDFREFGAVGVSG